MEEVGIANCWNTSSFNPHGAPFVCHFFQAILFVTSFKQIVWLESGARPSSFFVFVLIFFHILFFHAIYLFRLLVFYNSDLGSRFSFIFWKTIFLLCIYSLRLL